MDLDWKWRCSCGQLHSLNYSVCDCGKRIPRSEIKRLADLELSEQKIIYEKRIIDGLLWFMQRTVKLLNIKVCTAVLVITCLLTGAYGYTSQMDEWNAFFQHKADIKSVINLSFNKKAADYTRQLKKKVNRNIFTALADNEVRGIGSRIKNIKGRNILKELAVFLANSRLPDLNSNIRKNIRERKEQIEKITGGKK